MNKEQREAVARLRELSKRGYKFRAVSSVGDSRDCYSAVEELISLLAETEDERAMVVKVPRPRSGYCDESCPLNVHDEEGSWCGAGCEKSNDVFCSRVSPGDGCPWHEEEA